VSSTAPLFLRVVGAGTCTTPPTARVCWVSLSHIIPGSYGCAVVRFIQPPEQGGIGAASLHWPGDTGSECVQLCSILLECTVPWLVASDFMTHQPSRVTSNQVLQSAPYRRLVWPGCDRNSEDLQRKLAWLASVFEALGCRAIDRDHQRQGE